jgi:hypothetical protein
MEQLLDSGIPLEEEVISELRASCQGLALYQAGTPVENELFDLEFGGFGLIASIAICNDSPRTTTRGANSCFAARDAIGAETEVWLRTGATEKIYQHAQRHSANRGGRSRLEYCPSIGCQREKAR